MMMDPQSQAVAVTVLNVGFAIWLGWYLTTRVIPRLNRDHREEREAAHKEYLNARETTHKEHLAARASDLAAFLQASDKARSEFIATAEICRKEFLEELRKSRDAFAAEMKFQREECKAEMLQVDRLWREHSEVMRQDQQVLRQIIAQVSSTLNRERAESGEAKQPSGRG